MSAFHNFSIAPFTEGFHICDLFALEKKKHIGFNMLLKHQRSIMSNMSIQGGIFVQSLPFFCLFGFVKT